MQVPQGGWFPLAIAAVVLCMTAIWHWGSLLRLRHSQVCSARLVEDLLQDYKEHASTRCSLAASPVFVQWCPWVVDVISRISFVLELQPWQRQAMGWCFYPQTVEQHSHLRPLLHRILAAPSAYRELLLRLALADSCPDVSAQCVP